MDPERLELVTVTGDDTLLVRYRVGTSPEGESTVRGHHGRRARSRTATGAAGWMAWLALEHLGGRCGVPARCAGTMWSRTSPVRTPN
ncbi:hypothetical protein HBB16_21430 [Pseudonocardia sp. MCCB 268]|nr:hypothetical protein [Pseudonocardia cytotoxica]